MPKKPIWLDDFEMEILRGYLAEILDNPETPKYDIEILNDAYRQTLREDY
jgi:hypothetical protein